MQKWLAGQGLGSRRELESWIVAGRITVDGEIASLGQKVSGHESIRVDGRLLARAPVEPHPQRTLIYHKPIGEICTRNDPEGRPTVFEDLPRLKGQRWISIGRLDVQTSGLLLFTTDGELAHRLMHPRSALEREYAVRVQGPLVENAVEMLASGIELEDGEAHFKAIEETGGEGQNHWYRVVVAQGRNRVVRRLFEAVGGRVSRLIRVRFGPLALPRDVPRGRRRALEPSELKLLYQAADLPLPPKPPGPAPRKGDRRRR